MYLRILTLLLCLSISLSAAETPEAFMDRAAKSMAENETVTAQFTQVKKLKAFRRPLTITGELCIDRTGKFAWHVKTPVQYSCIIRDGKLMQWDAESGKTQTLSLDSNAALRYLASSLRNYFSGRFQEMKRDFTPTSYRDGVLAMQPKEGMPAAMFIAEIRFSFTGDLRGMERIEILEKTGDNTVITFSDMKRNVPIPEAKWQPGTR